MTRLRLTLRGKHLAIFDKHPFPWCEYQPVAGLRMLSDARVVDDTRYPGVYRLRDARGDVVLLSSSDTVLYSRLWLMYLYVFGARHRDWVPSVVTIYPLPWRLVRRTIPAIDTHIDFTEIRDASGAIVETWRQSDLNVAVFQAVFDLSVYAWDIYRKRIAV